MITSKSLTYIITLKMHFLTLAFFFKMHTMLCRHFSLNCANDIRGLFKDKPLRDFRLNRCKRYGSSFIAHIGPKYRLGCFGMTPVSTFVYNMSVLIRKYERLNFRGNNIASGYVPSSLKDDAHLIWIENYCPPACSGRITKNWAQNVYTDMTSTRFQVRLARSQSRVARVVSSPRHVRICRFPLPSIQRDQERI